jgi:hypothetical protein
MRNMEVVGTSHLEKLVKQRDQLFLEMEALRNKIAGLELAIRLISGEPEGAIAPAGGKMRVSETIVSLLREAGEAGLKPKGAIELAARRGISLNRGSVYSLLNRMQRGGIVVHEDTCYKLREFSRGRGVAFLGTDQARLINKH